MIPSNSLVWSNKRVKNVTIERGVVYGSEATPIPKKPGDENSASHRWKCYVRGPNHEDISYLIKKVCFHLHHSFENPRRIVETPPFEVEEAGWGEFEIVITLYFVDPSENAIDLFHPLKLFPPEGVPHPPNKPVISENFDQIVFAEPTEAFYEILMANPPPAASGPDVTKYDSRTDDVQEAADIAKIAEAQRKVREELWRLKEKYDALQRDVSTAQKQASRGPSMAKS